MPTHSTEKVSALQSQQTPIIHPSITVELIGSYVARHVESGLTVDLTSSRNRSTTKGPLSPLCRKLIENGHDAAGRIHVIRKALDRDGHIPVFKRDRTLKAWAGVDCVDSPTRSAYVVKHKPFPRQMFRPEPRPTAASTAPEQASNSGVPHHG